MPRRIARRTDANIVGSRVSSVALPQAGHSLDMAKARLAYNYMHDSDSTALVRFAFGSPKERRQLILGGSDAVSILLVA
jgi:hypothetical protein